MLNVDKEKCIACGTCTALCPQIFKMGEDGEAEVYNAEGDTAEQAQMCIDSCPVQAISK